MKKIPNKRKPNEFQIFQHRSDQADALKKSVQRGNFFMRQNLFLWFHFLSVYHYIECFGICQAIFVENENSRQRIENIFVRILQYPPQKTCRAFRSLRLYAVVRHADALCSRNRSRGLYAPLTIGSRTTEGVSAEPFDLPFPRPLSEKHPLPQFWRLIRSYHPTTDSMTSAT